MAELPKTPSFRVDGKNALITGGGSGIGYASAAALAEAGASITIAGRDRTRLEAAQRAFSDAGYGCAILALDVSDIAATRTALDSCAPFDILVNAAGVARNGPAFEVDEATYDLVTTINTKGAFFIAKLVAERMVAEAISGSIIQISSQMGHVGGIDRAVYCGSKHAIEGFTKAMAIEWGGHNIRVNTIAPTFIRTELTKPAFENPERLAWIMDKIKLGRAGTVEDIMGAVIYLASDASALVTGVSILVDGGWTAD